MLFVSLMAALAAGCTRQMTLRSDDFAERRRALQSIDVLPLGVTVATMHTGGVLETRVDLAGDARQLLASALTRRLVESDLDASIAGLDVGGPRSSELATQIRDINFLRAVENQITEFWLVAKPPGPFDYVVGKAAEQLLPGNGAGHAILCFRLLAVVPTRGRLVYSAAATGIAAAFGVPPTRTDSQAGLDLMLVETASGDVLWFRRITADLDIRQPQSVERLAHLACDGLGAER